MDLSSPTTMLAAWVLLPILVAVISGGLGLLLERVADARLGLLAFPFGFMAAVVAENLFIHLRLPADVASVLVGLLALAGIALRQFRPRENERTISAIMREPGHTMWAGAAAAIATYVLCMVPLLATGKIGILGYYLLNDPAFHITTAEWIQAHGFVHPSVADTSFSGASKLIESGYPTGTYSWPVIGITFLGTSAFALWTPLCALTLAMLAILGYGVVRRSGASAIWAVPLAVAIGAAYLPLSFMMQGGLKEVLFALSFTLSGFAAATILPANTDLKSLVRAAMPAALAIASMIVIFGPGAAVWIAQLAVLAFLIALVGAGKLGIPRLRVFLAAVLWGLLVILLTLPAVISALGQLSTVQAIAEANYAIGNLLGAVPTRSLLPGWVSGDYRVDGTTAGWDTISRVVVAAAGVLLLIGGIRELFSRRFFVPLTGITGAVAVAYLAYRYNVYFVAKGMVAFVPVISCAVASGLIWLFKSRGSYRALGVAIAAAFVVTLSAGYEQIYVHAWTTPTERFQELADINAKAAGMGPTVLNDHEEYGQSALRDADGVVPFTILTYLVTGTSILVNNDDTPTIAADLDGYRTEWLAKQKLIVNRRGPGGSRPPSNYDFWFQTKHFDIWRRAGEAPSVHIPFGALAESGLGELDCSSPSTRAVLRMAQASGSTVTVATRPVPTTFVPVDKIHQSPPWYPPDGSGYWTRPNNANGSFKVKLNPDHKYALYVQGQFGSGISAVVDGKEIGTLKRDFGARLDWSTIGSFVAGGETEVLIKPSGSTTLAPGGTRSDMIRSFGLVDLTSGEKLVRTDAAGARAFCGKQIDWLEVQ